MAIRYDYISVCCNTAYSETRDADQPMVYPSCVQCGQDGYTLVSETSLPEQVL